MVASKYKTLIKDVFIFAIGNIGSKLILFLMVPLYTNYLTTEQYGTADLIFTVAQLLIPVFSIVIYEPIIRFGLQRATRRENVLLNGFIVLGGSVVISLLSTFLFKLSDSIGAWHWHLSAYIIFSILYTIELNYVKVKGNNKLYSLLSVLNTFLMAALNIVFLVFMDLGVDGYLYAYIISTAVSSLLAFFLGKLYDDLRIAEFDSKLLREMVLYSTPLILNSISWWVIYSSDKVMLEVMMGSAALGLYVVAAKIPALINVFITIFAQAWGLSSIKEIESTKDSGYFSDIFKYYNLLVMAACLVFISGIRVFMRYYVGADFQEAWRYVPILLVSAAFSSCSSFWGTTLDALKKSMDVMKTTLTAAIINIVVNYVGIKMFGLWGAAIGTFCAYLVVSHIRYLCVRKYMIVKVNFRIYVINYLNIIMLALCVTFDFHMIFAICLAVIVFILNNYRDIRKLISGVIYRNI